MLKTNENLMEKVAQDDIKPDKVIVKINNSIDKLNSLVDYIDLMQDALLDYMSSSIERKRNLGFTLACEMVEKSKETTVSILEMLES